MPTVKLATPEYIKQMQATNTEDVEAENPEIKYYYFITQELNNVEIVKMNSEEPYEVENLLFGPYFTYSDALANVERYYTVVNNYKLQVIDNYHFKI